VGIDPAVAADEAAVAAGIPAGVRDVEAAAVVVVAAVTNCSSLERRRAD